VGHLILFRFNEPNAIVLQRSIENHSVTAIASYKSYVLAGTDSGSVGILSVEDPSRIIFHEFSEECRIIRIVVNASHGIVLAADRTAQSFRIDSGAITSAEFDFQKRAIGVPRCSAVSVSPKTARGALLDPRGELFMTDFADLLTSKKVKKCVYGSLLWSVDGFTLFALFVDGSCLIWNSVTDVSRQLMIPMLSQCNCAASGRHFLFVSVPDGLATFPLFQSGRNGCFFSGKNLIEFRATDNHSISISHDVSKSFSTDCEQIKFVASDPSARVLAVASVRELLLFDRVTTLWHRPPRSRVIVCGLAWIGEILLVIEFTEGNARFSMVSYRPIPFSEISSVDLPSQPLSIASDDSAVVLAFVNQVIVYRGDATETIAIPRKPISCAVYSPARTIAVLLEGRELHAFRDGAVLKVEPDISDFFLDQQTGLLFAVRGLKVHVISLTRKWLAVIFIQTAETVIGLLPNCFVVLSLPGSAVMPVSPTVHSYSDHAVCTQIRDTAKATEMLLRLRDSPKFPRLLVQVSVHALRNRLGRDLVPFLQGFPVLMKQSLAAALRAVESPERRGVFEVLGPPSRIFMEFAKLRLEQREVIKFVANEEAPATDLTAAAWLLPVILDEESPSVGFPAALFILSKVNRDPDSVESLSRFLEALLSPGVEIENGRLSCTGMIFEAKHYYKLKRRMGKIVDRGLCELFKEMKIKAIITLCESFRVNVVDFCGRYKTVDEEFTLTRLLDQLASMKTERVVSDAELGVIERGTRAGGWRVWTAALLLIGGRVGEAAAFLDRNPDLDAQLRQSQWKHLKEI
jgi:hypothetical protein